MRPWLTSALLSLSLALPTSALAPAAFLAGVVVADEAEARASSRSSGGYSRPSGGARTPSFNVPSRSPSMGSGGYRRPSLSPSPSVRPTPSQPSPSDRALSRSQSGQALERYRLDRQPPPAATRPAPPSSVPPSLPPSGARRHGQADEWAGYRSGGGYGGGWGGAWSGGWRPPGYAYNTPRFGIWDGLFLWFMLDNLTRAGSTDFFHNHRDDPGYGQWRAEAERRAQSDAELRAKLDQLDARLAEKQGQPRDPNYLPPDIPRDAALADDRPQPPATQGGSGMGSGVLIAVLLVGGGVVVMLWLARRRRTPQPAGAAPTPGPAGMAGRILRQTVSGERYTPSLFRVGMTLTVDPTPFILAGAAIKVPPPEAGSSGVISVEAVGTVTAGGTTLHRLYLPGGRSFFQVHLGADGRPDECRYFTAIDEVAPASNEEWAFWLDDAEGMIGWPEFQTKDGKLYARQWAPGSARVAPRELSETRADTTGERPRRLHAMLYAAPTGAAAPAPEVEYVLVSAVEEAGQAWVEVHAGIDVNPATLSLA